RIAKSRKVGNRPIVVKQIKNLTSAPDCHIVFLTESMYSASVLKVINSKPILLVTHSEGLLEKGSDLNFLRKGDKLFYQLNASSLHEKKIKVSSAFSSMAEKII
ncbi:MAG: YfiR family protein, partial [Cyclobacteriaceae bacterium]|nr:YfiR family protein [Cyclobacteriaceae bacterium]